MLDAAVARWRALIGDEHVWTDDERLRAAGTATFATTQRVLAVIRPANREQVQACVKVAHELRVPLHPTSRGRNWGYGSRVPHRDAVVLDLARLDRIVDFDERMGYVTVEPGVTFWQLSRFLRTNRARVFASVTGGTSGGSVIANALERGDGTGPLGDRFGYICALEVVLPDGDVIHTGFARFGEAPIAPLARWGVGPYLDGLFSQSTFGVVTRATIWLAPYPARFVLAMFNAEELPPLIDALRGLKLAGVTTATTPVWNDVKALSFYFGQYPWSDTTVTPLPTDMREMMREGVGLGRWNGTVALYGASRAHGDALRDVVADVLSPIADVRFHEGPDDPLEADEAECAPNLGVPHDFSAATTYWRKTNPIPTELDPDRDRCGFVWLSHAMPFDGAHAGVVDEIVETEFASAGFEPNLALLGVTERALSAVAAIVYDRDVDGEDERAMQCHDRVHSMLVERGYPPFRRGVQTPAAIGEPRYAQLVDDIARVIDPHGVFGARG
ncbi:MAG: FAD-dependent oxidoreductase [Nocardiaceae bacterium]|nr:FAD-dependent oxidoreductase [Nocardiaceae bacterium]